VQNQPVTLNNQERANLNSQQFQQYFSVKPDDFQVILIGYDQGEKLRQSEIDVDRLFAEIDQMPIRQQEMAEQAASTPERQEQTMQEQMIDDRRSETMQSNLGGEWQLISDQVMGGVSSGSATITEKDGRSCVQMTGNVSTDNNGGFLQIALDLNGGKAFDASQYTGIKLDVWGNQENYGLHLRTKGLWFPWQAYRSNFDARSEWETVTLPFSEFQAYKTSQVLNPAKLKRIGLVAIGRDFEADICLGKIVFYR
ncbi:MAG: CIA30 family protein, partial [bacterium]